MPIDQPPAIIQTDSTSQGPSSGTVTIPSNVLRAMRSYKWEPQADITPYELAQAIPLFFNTRGPANAIEELPPEVKRHFKLNAQ